ncbi:MAG TPA: abortive infection family protein [Thermoanaerobaculia bacterium]|nr:abortive infection family protein [Thermoanaerobaculia bacterium]
MLDIDQVILWLRQSGETEAAALLERAEQEPHWVDTAFELHGDREWDVYDIDLKVPADVLRTLDSLPAPCAKIEAAYQELAHSVGCIVRAVNWFPRLPDPVEAASVVELQTIDAPHVRELWRKAVSRVPTDPDGAVTSARSLLEGVCKHVLFDLGVAYSPNADLPQLLDLVMQRLRLSPRHQTDKRLKQALGNVQAVVGAVAALRGQLGDAHAKAPGIPGATVEQAELAVNLAGAVSLFIARERSIHIAQSGA